MFDSSPSALHRLSGIRILFWVGALLATAACSLSLRAEADGPDYFRVTGIAAGQTLPVYIEPYAERQKVGALAPDANGIKNLGCKGGLTFAEWEKATPAEREAGRKARWCHIQYRDLGGRLASR